MKLPTDEIERLERLANRGERLLLVAFLLVVAAIICAAVGLPLIVAVVVACAGAATTTLSALDLLPVIRQLVKTWQERRRNRGRDGHDDE